MTDDIKGKDITNLMFMLGYISEYRFQKQLLLENQHENVQDIISDLKPEQYENLRQMIEIEMIINSVQYSEELGAFAIIIKNKRIFEIIKMLSSLSEKSIKDFYDQIEHADFELLRKYMGYHEISIAGEDIAMYDRSCKRYQNDILNISKFYDNHYQLYLSYKHGLRLIPAINDDGQKLIFEACKDNTLTVHKIPEMWWLNSIEITEIINNIFKKLYVPLIRKNIGEYLEVSFTGDMHTSVEATDSPDPAKTLHFQTSIIFPWWIHNGKEPKPFY